METQLLNCTLRWVDASPTSGSLNYWVKVTFGGYLTVLASVCGLAAHAYLYRKHLTLPRAQSLNPEFRATVRTLWAWNVVLMVAVLHYYGAGNCLAAFGVGVQFLDYVTALIHPVAMTSFTASVG